MTDHPTTDHPSDERLVGRLDGASGDAALEAHLAACPACHARAAELERLWTALRAEPPTVTPEVFAAQRARIQATLARRSPTATPHRPAWRRTAWASLAAAAVVAAILVLVPRDHPGLSVLAQADSAAARAAATMTPSSGALADDSMAEEPDPWSLAAVPGYESARLEESFSNLSEADRAAILRELAEEPSEL